MVIEKAVYMALAVGHKGRRLRRAVLGMLPSSLEGGVAVSCACRVFYPS